MDRPYEEAYDEYEEGDEIDQGGLRHPGLIALLVLVVLIIVSCILIVGTVFVVQDIKVEGTNLRSAEDVIALSRIEYGAPLLGLSENEIRVAINMERYLVFDSMSLTFPNSVVLRVHERKPSAAMTYLGVLYVLDETGRVLDQQARLDIPYEVPVVTGIDVSNVEVGQTMISNTQGQLDAMNKVLTALEKGNMLLQTSELSVSNLDNLYIMTSDGMKIELGDSSKLDQKVMIAQGILRQSDDGELSGGRLDVSSGESGFYRK